AGRGHAGNEQVDESRLLRSVAATRCTQRHLTASVALLRSKMPPMQIDDPPLGNLAEPRKRIAVADLGRRQGPHRFGACLLKNIIGLDLSPQGRAKLALNVGHELETARLNKFRERIGIAALNFRW